MGKKYDLPQKDNMSTSGHSMELPVHIVCHSDAKYNKSLSLRIEYARDTKLSDVFHHIEHYVSTALHNEHNTTFNICGVSKKSFTNKTILISDDREQWLQCESLQYDSIANYEQSEITERGVHIVVRKQGDCGNDDDLAIDVVVDAEQKSKSTAKPKPKSILKPNSTISAGIRKPLQTLCINNLRSNGNEQHSNLLLEKRLSVLCNTVDVAFVHFHDNMRHFRNKEQVYARELDEHYVPNKQSAINWAMREILIDWFYDLQIDLKVDNETLFAAIQYVDLYLSQFDIARVQLQLLGVTAILLASKTYEIIPQPISELIYLSNDQYSRKDIVHLERKLLKTLRWTAFQVTPYNYIKPWLSVLDIECHSKENLLIDLLINTASLSPLYLRHALSVLVGVVIYLSAVVYLRNECALDVDLLHAMCPETSNKQCIMRSVHELVMALVEKGTKHRDTSSIYRRFKNDKYLQTHYALSTQQIDLDTFPFQQNFAKFAQNT